MDFTQLGKAISSAPDQETFNAWLVDNFSKVSAFLYNLPIDDLEVDFDRFYFGVFSNSIAYKTAQLPGYIRTEAFDAFLTVLAGAAERLAEMGYLAPLDNLLQVLPDSSIKYRLKSLVLLNNINDARIDYNRLFPEIMLLLDRAANADEDSSEYHIVDLLIFYFKKAQKSISRLGDSSALINLRQQFAADDTIDAYPFAAHPKLQRLVHGESAEEDSMLEMGPIETVIPSRLVEDLFAKLVNRPVLDHPRSVGVNHLMGYSKDEITGRALVRGRADFRVPYKGLSAEDKVLLYCYFNMKKHYCTSLGVFRKIWPFIENLFSDPIFVPLFIDIGCGPLTSGLALGDQYYAIYGSVINYHYIGVDIAPAMLQKAAEFHATDLFNGSPEPKFFTNWDEISFEYLHSISSRNHPVIVNASYFFASEFLDPLDFANFISKLVAAYADVYFVFQNPQAPERNRKYVTFKEQFDFQVIDSKNDSIKYKTKLFSDVKEEELLYEILKLHKPVHAV